MLGICWNTNKSAWKYLYIYSSIWDLCGIFSFRGGNSLLEGLFYYSWEYILWIRRFSLSVEKLNLLFRGWELSADTTKIEHLQCYWFLGFRFNLKRRGICVSLTRLFRLLEWISWKDKLVCSNECPSENFIL